jgi:nucleoside-diphosphate-sugar epimerase
MKILILGSGGFIGRKLSKELKTSGHEITDITRSTNSKEFLINPTHFDTIINCASSLPNATPFQAHDSNFNYPKKFLEYANFDTWLQIESYYQKQIPFGRRDNYTLEKEAFSSLLRSRVTTHREHQYKFLTLPHIFGEGDRKDRLINSAIATFSAGGIFKVVNSQEYLPLLHIADAVTGIVNMVQSDQDVAECEPFWNAKVIELIRLIQNVILRGNIHVSENIGTKVFPRLDFINSVSNYHPKMGIVEFRKWIKEKKL